MKFITVQTTILALALMFVFSGTRPLSTHVEYGRIDAVQGSQSSTKTPTNVEPNHANHEHTYLLYRGGLNYSQTFFDALDKQNKEIAHAKEVKAMKLRHKIAREALEKQRAAKIAAQASSPIRTTQVAPVYHSTYTGSLAQWLLTLRTCESGGNYQTNTGNGFYGAYQFTIATWNHWNTGYARADFAPPAVQDATIIKNTLASSGLSSQNPGCYASQHLSNYPPQ